MRFINKQTRWWCAQVIGTSLVGIFLVACGGDDDNPVEPPPLPTINLFEATPSDIMPGDSSLITYQTSHAMSVALHPGAVAMTPVAAGEYWIHPEIPTDYELRAANSSGADSAALTISMTGAVPSIERFVLSETGILPGDSTVLSWKTVRADQIVFDNGLGSSTADSGQFVLHPSATTVYTAIASNLIGADTASVEVLIEVANSIFTVNGRHYLGSMGSSAISPQLRFQVLDAASNALQKPWINFSLVEGDGTLATDSAQPGLAKYVVPGYTFSGQLGHAVLRGSVSGIASHDVDLRASVIIPGADGQGQYIRFGDSYADVKNYNSFPASVDVHPAAWINFANYESALGLVVAIEDANQNELADDNEQVAWVILNTVYDKQTAEGIGIGSPIADIRSAYGSPDNTYYDAEAPAAQVLEYDALGATFFCFASAGTDSALFEIHLTEPVAPVGQPAAPVSQPVAPASTAKLRPRQAIDATGGSEPAGVYRRSYRPQGEAGTRKRSIH